MCIGKIKLVAFIIIFYSSFAKVFAQPQPQNAMVFNQDTVSLTIAEAEQRFVSKNLTLLINKFNIDIANANYLQAKLWYNPNLSYWQEMYNSSTKKVLNQADESGGQISQLLTIAGRHKATWKLAQVGVKLAEYQFADLLRNLKYELHTGISDLYFNQQLIKMYQNEEVQIKHLLEGTRELYKHGNAAKNDVIQLQAQLQDIIAQEITSKQATYNDLQDLKILLLYPEKTYFVVKELPTYKTGLPTYGAVLDSAEKNRPDLLLSYVGSEYAQKNLKLQRATAMPDLMLSTTYETANDYQPNFYGIQASMDLPVWNRNQWNIAAAKYGIQQAELTDTLTFNTVKNQVTNAYCTLLLTNKQLNLIDPQYGNDLNEMMDNAIKNFEHHNINLLALLSYISTYNDGKTNLINLNVQYFNAIHNINLNTGVELIK